MNFQINLKIDFLNFCSQFICKQIVFPLDFSLLPNCDCYYIIQSLFMNVCVLFDFYFYSVDVVWHSKHIKINTTSIRATQSHISTEETETKVNTKNPFLFKVKRQINGIHYGFLKIEIPTKKMSEVEKYGKKIVHNMNAFHLWFNPIHMKMKTTNLNA